MRKRVIGRLPSFVTLYEATVALCGWGALIASTHGAPPSSQVLPAFLFLLLIVALKHEGFQVARLVTHSLAGIAALAAILALEPPLGAWVVALAGLAFLASRAPADQRRFGPAHIRLLLFGGGLSALMALGGAWLHRTLGGRWAQVSLTRSDLGPLLALCLAWFLADHLGWSVRIGLEEGLAGVRRFLRAIQPYSLVVELLPLPLASVLAITYRGPGLAAFALFALFLLGVGQMLRLLNLNLTWARKRVADLTTVNAFSWALLAAKLDVMEMCRLLQTHTASVADARHLWLGLYDARRGRLEAVLTGTEGPGAAGAPAPDPGLVAWLQKSRVPLRIEDAQHEELPFTLAQPDGSFRSGLYVPLVAAGNLIGLLAVESPEPGTFTREDLRTIATFANQTAMAIQNARTYEAEQRRAREIATVGEVGRRVVSILGMDQLFAQVVHLVRDAFAYYHVQLFTVDPATGDVEFQASTCPLIQEQGLSVARGQGLLGWVAETGQQAVVNDVTADPRYRLIEGLEDTSAEAVLPLKVDERLVGILDVQSEQPDAFAQDDLFVLQTLADQVAIAIEDNRLYRAEKARRQLADTLREMASALNSTLELHAVLDLVLTQLQRVIAYDAAGILEWRHDAFCLVAGRGGQYASPNRCLSLAENAQLRQLTVEPAPRVYEVGGPDPASSLATPLLVRNRLIGALILERQGSAAGYRSEEIQVVSVFADQAAVAIENARLYEAAQRRARQLATIAEVGQRVASILDLGELFGQVVHLVRQEFGYYHVSLYTVEPETAAVEFRASTDPLIQEQGLAVHAGEGIIAWVAAHGEALLANDVAAEPRYCHDEVLPDTRSELAVPLRVEGRTVGVLDVQSDHLEAFSAEDLFITQTLADQVAVAIENARLYAAQQEEAWVSTALLQVAETLANLISLDEVLDAVARLVPLLIGVERCFIFLRDEDTSDFRAVRAHGLAGAEREAFLGQNLAGLAPDLAQALQESTGPVAVGEIGGTERRVESALGLQGGLALPLRAGGEMIGVLAAGYVQAVLRPNRNRRAILTGIANQAAMAIQNAHLYIAQREEAWVSTALLQVAELAGRTKDLDEILAGLVRLTPMLAGVDRCCIFLWDRDGRRYLPSQVYGLSEALRQRFHSLSPQVGDFPLLDRVREAGEPLAGEVLAGSELVPAVLAQEFGMLSVLALPLRSQAEVQGVMLVDYTERPHHFSQRRIALLSGLTNQAAIAIENVRLYRESLESERIAQELQVARQIQASFLPEACPALPGWSIAATSQPAREVGGDFYDFIPLGANRLGLVIADVSDKGVPAALLMALSRTVMRAVAAGGRSPAAALRRANELLLSDARSGMFVTLFYGILDAEEGELTFASAGHNPPYWRRRRGGELVRLARRGIALGVVENPAFEQDQIILRPGDALVLYTDGVTEAFDPEEHAFGERGLQQAIRSAGVQPAEPMMAAINQAVQTFVRGARQADDYTLLVIMREA